MKIAICGGTGFIGSALTDYWLKSNHHIMIITRKLPENERAAYPNLEYVSWEQLEVQPERMEGFDALVNLAGETLNQRWTGSAKMRILESRVTTAAKVARLVSSLERKPEVVVQASAMAIYGTSATETFDEDSPLHAADFPAHVSERWEAASKEIKGTRLSFIRISLVLGHKGAFPLMKLPYLVGFGGKLGSGKQWTSWIHIHDMVRLIDFTVQNKSISGPVNAASPHPVTNDEFGKTVGKVFRRPHWFPVPGFLIQALVGEMSMLVLQGQRVIPRKALDHGFRFSYPTLQEALEDLKSH